MRYFQVTRDVVQKDGSVREEKLIKKVPTGKTLQDVGEEDGVELPREPKQYEVFVDGEFVIDEEARTADTRNQPMIISRGQWEDLLSRITELEKKPKNNK